MIYLRNIPQYKSCSAFAPVTNPVVTKWGQKAFKNYIGGTESDWKQYDSTELVQTLNAQQKAALKPILIDQGTDDFALSHGDDKHDQLRTKQFEAICKANGVAVDVRYQEGYGMCFECISSRHSMSFAVSGTVPRTFWEHIPRTHSGNSPENTF